MQNVQTELAKVHLPAQIQENAAQGTTNQTSGLAIWDAVFCVVMLVVTSEHKGSW